MFKGAIQPLDLIGRKIVKHFQVNNISKPFYGFVKKKHLRSLGDGKVLYHYRVLYTDGDEEDMTYDEVVNFLVAKKANGNGTVISQQLLKASVCQGVNKKKATPVKQTLPKEKVESDSSYQNTHKNSGKRKIYSSKVTTNASKKVKPSPNIIQPSTAVSSALVPTLSKPRDNNPVVELHLDGDIDFEIACEQFLPSIGDPDYKIVYLLLRAGFRGKDPKDISRSLGHMSPVKLVFELLKTVTNAIYIEVLQAVLYKHSIVTSPFLALFECLKTLDPVFFLPTTSIDEKVEIFKSVFPSTYNILIYKKFYVPHIMKITEIVQLLMFCEDFERSLHSTMFRNYVKTTHRKLYNSQSSYWDFHRDSVVISKVLHEYKEKLFVKKEAAYNTVLSTKVCLEFRNGRKQLIVSEMLARIVKVYSVLSPGMTKMKKRVKSQLEHDIELYLAELRKIAYKKPLSDQFPLETVLELFPKIYKANNSFHHSKYEV